MGYKRKPPFYNNKILGDEKNDNRKREIFKR